jgi:hypothetical protein
MECLDGDREVKSVSQVDGALKRSVSTFGSVFGAGTDLGGAGLSPLESIGVDENRKEEFS